MRSKPMLGKVRDGGWSLKRSRALIVLFTSVGYISIPNLIVRPPI